MRNGDILPSRFIAQTDAVGLLSQAKLNANPENTIGLMTIGGNSPQVLVTSTADDAKVIASMHEVKIDGQVDLMHGLQVAQLALKHRQNKVQRQRIICFIGSPVFEDVKELEKLGKKLKKNNVSVDIITFGEEIQDNRGKLEKFVNSIGNEHQNRLLVVPSGNQTILSDYLINSPIVRTVDEDEEGGAPSTSNFEFGVDPSLDPELAMALRMSMEEEQARQNQQSQQTNNDNDKGKDVKVDDSIVEEGSNDVEMNESKQDVNKGDNTQDEQMDDEEAEIQKAVSNIMKLELYNIYILFYTDCNVNAR